MKGVLQFVLSFIGALLFCMLLVFLIAFVTIEDVSQIQWTMFFLGTLLLFYVFLSSLIWEALFHFTRFTSWWKGAFFYLFLGVLCGGIAITIVHFNIGKTDVLGWIGGMVILGFSAIVFYSIRRVPS